MDALQPQVSVALQPGALLGPHSEGLRESARRTSDLCVLLIRQSLPFYHNPSSKLNDLFTWPQTLPLWSSLVSGSPTTASSPRSHVKHFTFPAHVILHVLWQECHFQYFSTPLGFIIHWFFYLTWLSTLPILNFPLFQFKFLIYLYNHSFPHPLHHMIRNSHQKFSTWSVTLLLPPMPPPLLLNTECKHTTLPISLQVGTFCAQQSHCYFSGPFISHTQFTSS